MTTKHTARFNHPAYNSPILGTTTCARPRGQEFNEVKAETEEHPSMTLNSAVTKAILDDIVNRIVEVARPQRIIMFGSAARGEMGPNSDVDLLVVKEGTYSRLRLAGKIYRRMQGVGQAVDIIVVTPEDVERYRNSHALVIAPALRDGKVIYAA